MIDIRKVSVGHGVSDVMHYQVGAKMGQFVIDCIIEDKKDIGSYLVYVKKDKEVKMWKKLNRNLPMSIESNLFY